MNIRSLIAWLVILLSILPINTIRAQELDRPLITLPPKLQSLADSNDWSLLTDYEQHRDNELPIRVLLHTSNLSTTKDRLHIYIHGDGQPWVDGGRRIALDPSPLSDPALALMALDTQTSLFLGRPCYYQLHPTMNCHPQYWTDGRYSEAVITSMLQRIIFYKKQLNIKHITLIGFSGGGTIAWLLSQRIEAVDQLVTIAANLDTDAWTEYHGYAPLKTSINPSNTQAPRLIQHWSLAAKNDSNIPYHLWRQAKALNHAKTLYYDHFDHSCCWQTIWPDILTVLKK